MTVLVVFSATDKEPARVEVHAEAEAARNLGNGHNIYPSPEDLAAGRAVDTAVMVEIFNTLAETPVKRFSDRLTAAKRLWAIAHEKLEVVGDSKRKKPAAANPETSTDKTGDADNEGGADAGGTGQENSDMASKKKAADAAKKKATAAKGGEAKKPGNGVRGKKSAYEGKKLYPVADACKDGNPRRAGSAGHKSMEIIIKNPGITYEEFIKKGGRAKDVLWDVAKKNARVA
jgi:hypothetical protein